MADTFPPTLNEARVLAFLLVYEDEFRNYLERNATLTLPLELKGLDAHIGYVGSLLSNGRLADLGLTAQIKSTCMRLAIRPTYAAINAYVRGLEQPQ